jgi:hypothetical protein
MFALHDFDGDGVPELHSACYRKQEPLEVFRFAKGEAGEPVLRPFVLGAEGGGHGFAFGDVNGDGREDVLTEVGWYERPAGDPFAGPWKLHPETALPHPSCPFVVKDLNGDGRLDIVFGRGHDFGLYWWEQQLPKPDGTQPGTARIDGPVAGPRSALAPTGDGGGVVARHLGPATRVSDRPPSINTVGPRPFSRHTIAPPVRALGRQFAVVDVTAMDAWRGALGLGVYS